MIDFKKWSYDTSLTKVIMLGISGKTFFLTLKTRYIRENNSFCSGICSDARSCHSHLDTVRVKSENKYNILRRIGQEIGKSGFLMILLSYSVV